MRTAFITGSSRGIGKAIALKLAKKGYNIAVAAKTATPHPRLPGTIYSAAEEIEKAGGKALPIVVDIRNEEMVKSAVQQCVDTFGGIDILINNASAIGLTPIEYTDMKRYDLMHDVNVRGTYMVSKYCVPHLKKGNNPHILNLSPPLNLDPDWFGRHLAYTMSKYGMSMTILGLSNELEDAGVAANALWPKTVIATTAVKNMPGGEMMVQACRTPEIMADAAAVILEKNSQSCTGNFFIDEEVLQAEGVQDFTKYAVDPSQQLLPDLFL